MAAAAISERRTNVAHAWITAEVYRKLSIEAERRGLHPDALAGLIVTNVLAIGLANFLLED